MSRDLINFNDYDPELLFRGLDPTKRGDKDSFTRLRKYLMWLEARGQSWLLPDLAEFRDFLVNESGLSLLSAKIHLSTVRARYRAMLEGPELDEELRRLLAHSLSEEEINEAIRLIREAVESAVDTTKVTIEAKPQPLAHLRLTTEQACELMRMPGLDTLAGIRDTVLIAVLLTTGVRVAEACVITVKDLRHETPEGVGLRVEPTHKGKEPRIVPYGEMSWVLILLDHWLKKAEITDGPVFRAFNKTLTAVRRTRLSVRAVDLVLSSLPLMIDEKEVVVTPMVLRRTYASRLYEEGVPLGKIQEYLGVGTTAMLDYVGDAPRKVGTQGIPNLYAINQKAVEDGIRTGQIRPTSETSATEN